MNVIESLSVHIGPRGSCTEQEKQAAAFLSSTLSSFNYSVREDAFKCPSTFSWAQILLITFFLISWIFFVIQPLVSACLCFSTLILYILEVDTRFSITKFLPKAQSQNVIAASPIKSNKPKIVVCAHYDTSRSSLNFSPSMVPSFRKSFILLFISMILLALCCVANFILILIKVNYSLYFFYGTIPLVLVLLSVFISLVHRELCFEFVHGANDNASGVSVLVKTAEHLRNYQFLNNIEFVATGAEEAGTFGISNYIKRYGIKNTIFINLDNLGTGNLFVTSSEGCIFKYQINQKLREAVEKVLIQKSKLPISISPYNLLTTDATVVMARKGLAFSVMAKDENNLLPNWHWKTDTIDKISVENLDFACEFVLSLVTNLDKNISEFFPDFVS
ncbi:hypothetical protein RCL1_002349 [Eukaryota sp. TZLM3-RCL]